MESANQATLFPELGVVEAAKRWEHNGVTTCKDEELCAGICEAAIQGHSQRWIARTFGVGPMTVRAVIEEMERRGKMRALKERVRSKLGVAIELGIERAVEMLEAGSVPANVLPIMVGVFSDKKALLDGEPTMIVRSADSELTVEALNRVIEGLPRAKRPVTIEVTGDSQSTGNDAKGQ